MPRTITIEEFHVSLHIPLRLPAKKDTAIRRTLRSPSFGRRLRQAVQEVIARGPHLESVVVEISR